MRCEIYFVLKECYYGKDHDASRNVQCSVAGRDDLHRRRRYCYPGYPGWYKASTEIRDYRKKNPNTWLDTGLDAFVSGCEKSVTNAIYGIGCAYNFVAINIATSGLGLIPAAYIIFKK